MRIAFRMRVHPGHEEEYIERHNPIWPQLEALLKERGVCSYSIFLDRTTGDLFAYAEIDDLRGHAARGVAEVAIETPAVRQGLNHPRAERERALLDDRRSGVGRRRCELQGPRAPLDE